MMRPEDRLDELMARHNPVHTQKDAPLDAATIAMRDRITERNNIAPLPRQVSRFALSTAVAVTVAVVVVSATLLWPRSTAEAWGPEPLNFTDVGTASQIAAESMRTLRAHDGPTAPRRETTSVAWNLNVDDDKPVAITPQYTQLTWSADLSAHIRIVEGEPGANPTLAEPDGTVIADQEIAAGEFGTPLVDSPGQTEEDMRLLLSVFGAPADATAGQLIESIVSINGQWTLTDEQHSRLVEELAMRTDVEALGAGKDRIGRAVLGLRAPSSLDGVDDIMLISSESGRIIGVETQLRTADGLIPANTVVSYTLWE